MTLRGRRVRRSLLLLSLGTVAGCGEPAPEHEVHVTGPCEAPVPWADLPADVQETSGVAASHTYPGVFWTHNDSGGDSAVFAIDSTGAVLARVRVRRATNRDWEDIAAAPCDSAEEGQCLFLADIGDNRERRDNVLVLRFPEPDPGGDSITGPVDRLIATYPNGPRDAEALFVNGAGIHIVTKGRSQNVELYRLDPSVSPGRTGVLRRVQELAPPPTSMSAQVTGAATSPDGSMVVLRTYSGLRFFEPHGDSIRQIGHPADFLGPAQPLGEGVDFIGPGRLVLTGEAGGRQPATIASVRCSPRQPTAPEPATRP